MSDAWDVFVRGISPALINFHLSQLGNPEDDEPGLPGEDGVRGPDGVRGIQGVVLGEA